MTKIRDCVYYVHREDRPYKCGPECLCYTSPKTYKRNPSADGKKCAPQPAAKSEAETLDISVSTISKYAGGFGETTVYELVFDPESNEAPTKYVSLGDYEKLYEEHDNLHETTKRLTNLADRILAASEKPARSEDNQNGVEALDLWAIKSRHQICGDYNAQTRNDIWALIDEVERLRQENADYSVVHTLADKWLMRADSTVKRLRQERDKALIDALLRTEQRHEAKADLYAERIVSEQLRQELEQAQAQTRAVQEILEHVRAEKEELELWIDEAAKNEQDS